MTRSCLFLLLLLSSFPAFSQWQQTGGPEGSRVYALEQVGSTIYAGTLGGLYLSTDDGATWVLSNTVPVEQSVVAIENNGNEVLMLVAKVNDDLDAWEYVFYQSTDSGQTWAVKTTPAWSWLLDDGFQITRKGTALYALANNQYYRSFDNGITWTYMAFPDYPSSVSFGDEKILMATYYALFISEDQGDTWTFVDSVGTQSGMLFEDPLIMLNTVYDSIHISQDLGATWTVVPAPAGYYTGKLDRGSSGKVYAYGYSNIYASSDNGTTWDSLPSGDYTYNAFDVLENGTDLLLGSSTGIYRLQNGASQWIRANNGLIATTVYYLFASPNNELFAYTNSGNFRSPNGGLNWFSFNLGSFWNPIYDMEFIGDTMYIASENNLYVSTGGDFTPLLPSGSYYSGFSVTLNEGKIYYTGYYGIYSSADGGVTWDTISLPTTNYWDDIAFFNGNTLVINSQGDGFISTDNGANWTQVLNVWSPGAGHKNRFFKFGNYLYLPDGDNFWRSADGGFTWEDLQPTGLPFNAGSFPETLLPSSLAGIGNLLFATVPFNGVYISSDYGLSWEPINDGLGNMRTRRCAIGNGILYTGTSNGGVWRRGGQFESVTGLVYNDTNNNGQKEPDEPVIPNTLVRTSPLNSYTNTQLDGTFFLYGQSFSDTLEVALPTPYATVNPPYYLIQGSSSGNDFGIYYTPNIKDLSVTMTSLEPFRPGFDNTLFLTVTNIGTVAQNATTDLHLQAALQYTGSSVTPASINGNDISWDLGTMQPFESRNLQVQVVLDASTPIGDIITSTANVAPVVDDETPNNNQYELREEVVGSFDPNDKTVEPMGYITPAQLAAGQPLIYTIRFQNTGNYLAENVRILDTLSTKLDLSSIQVLSSSHPVEWFVRNGRLLEFVFENIFLPDSISNEPASHGFVKFSIRPNANLALGEGIDNNADIYFDFNAPIRTNTASISIDNESLTFEKENGQDLIVSPNPNTGNFMLSLPNAAESLGDLRIMDEQGKIQYHCKWGSGQKSMNMKLSNLSAGSYFIQLKSGEKTWVRKVLIVN